MSLGLNLLAHLSQPSPDPEQLILQLEAWLQRKYADMLPQTRRESTNSVPALFCQLHPAAEEFELSLVGPAKLVASASTSVLGPGYHVFLCELLRDLAHDFNGAWETPAADSEEYLDETGFFFTGDEQGLRSEMTSWLAGIARCFSPDGPLDLDDPKGTALCLPINPQFEDDHPARTPLGPRDRDWIERTARDGNSGTDFFAWWMPGFNAEYYLRRALAHMWTNVRWRLPVNDSERSVLEDTADSLRRAYGLDPNLQYPWAEWKQVLDLLNQESDETELVNSHAYGTPTIGYRRRSVTVTLPGRWSVKIPGSFSDCKLDEEGDFCTVDPPREIWFSVYDLKGGPSPAVFESRKRSMQAARNPDYVVERENYFAQATISKKQLNTGEEYSVLNSFNLTLGGQLILTIVFPGPEQQDWAMETWRSIKPPSISEA